MLWILLPLLAHSATLEEIYAQKLMHERSAHAVRVLRDRFEELKAARIACRVQLAEARMPESCFETLALERQWGLPPRVEWERKLERLCARAAASLRVPARDSEFLTPKCRTHLMTARKVETYRQGEDIGPDFD